MSEPGGDMRTLVEHVVKALVDAPDQVAINQIEDDQGAALELRVAPNDLGKVIGRQGRTARALRALLNAAGSKTQKRYSLEIIE
jgi:predicted RNA-binding protein YlqC (UPF0109 family)